MERQHYRANRNRAWFEVTVTVLPYILGLVLTSELFERSLSAFLLSGFITALFSVRLFSIFHDCSHRSFHPDKNVCLWLGRLCGFLSGFTPFSDWTRTHLSHHTNLNNLDLKLPGDILTYTVQEFQALSPGKKIAYRIYRHPVFLVGFGGLAYFLVYARIPWLFPKETRRSIWATNGAFALFLLGGCTLLGVKSFFATQLFVLWISTMIGVVIFYIHPQFEDAYFSRGASWKLAKTSLDGSSYFHFPAIIQWFTMNIGYHHIHHLNSMIPGYNLPEAAKSRRDFAEKNALGWKDIRNSFRLKLYCEKASKLVPF